MMIRTIFNFNSHAHVERDVISIVHKVTAHRISTHTLTWSVTAGSLPEPNIAVFQLTRSRGA